MSDYNLKRLENAVSYAMETGSFCIKNVIKNSDYFCIWGAGNFFTGAYERWFTNYGIHLMLGTWLLAWVNPAG